MINKVLLPLLLAATVSFAFAGETVESCSNISEESFFPVGDELGKIIPTKRTIVQDCNITITTIGACQKWQETKEEESMRKVSYNSYRSTNHSGSMGGLLAMIGSYDQMSSLWSGWKGYCEFGTKRNFDWAQDPSFWASMVMSSVMDGQDALKGGPLDLGAVNENVGSAWGSIGKEAGYDFAKDMSKEALKELGKCSVGFGVDMSKNLYGFLSETGNKDCDPVDEFCDEDGKGELAEADIRTITRAQYNDILRDFPESAGYLEVIDDGSDNNGVMTVSFKPASSIPGFDEKTKKEMNEAMQEMKDMQFLISSAMTAAKLGSCMATSGAVGSKPSTSSDAGRFSLKNGLSEAINMLPDLGPYGFMIKGALSVALEVATSFQDINTCDDEDDAKEAGDRHSKTQQSIPFNLCKITESSCQQKEVLGNGCSLHSKSYCCYDQPLSKALVVQIKAQLGRDWAHCTGISLDDMKLVDFRECTDEDMKVGFDAETAYLQYNADGELINDPDWTKSFQYKRKCLNLRPFKEELQKSLNTNLDFSEFEDSLKDLGGKEIL